MSHALCTLHTHHTLYILTYKHMFCINHTWFITCHISWCHVSDNSVPDTMFSVGYQTIQIASHISCSMHQISTYSLNIMLNKSNQICVHGPARPALICLDIQILTFCEFEHWLFLEMLTLYQHPILQGKTTLIALDVAFSIRHRVCGFSPLNLGAGTVQPSLAKAWKQHVLAIQVMPRLCFNLQNRVN